MRGKLKRQLAPLAAALLIGLTGCGGAADSSEEPAKSAETSGEQSSSESPKPEDQQEGTQGDAQHVAFGEPIEYEPDEYGTLQVTIQPPEDSDGANADLEPDGKFVVFKARAKLVKGDMAAIGEDDFTLVDADGQQYEPSPAALEDVEPLIDVLTSAGETLDSAILYDVPPAATGFSLEYRPTDTDDQPIGFTSTWK